MYKFSNPIVEGYYADPEARIYEGKYYIYATRSKTDYKQQLNIDAFSSSDLKTWEKHDGIIDMSGFPHMYQATWAPTIIEKGGKYYLVFATNDIHSDDEPGGLEIAVSDTPQGPFKAYLGKPLVGEFVNGAQPIDAHLFKDDDGTIYLYYGGWSHCNVAKMNDDMTGFVPFEGDEMFREITPPSYVEGPCMIKHNGIYYFMWSKGNWGDGSYCVCYTSSRSPIDGIRTVTENTIAEPTVILARQEIAEGPGHHGYLYVEETDTWLIVYHRRFIGDKEAGNRVLCIDEMKLHDGIIEPVIMT